MRVHIAYYSIHTPMSNQVSTSEFLRGLNGRPLLLTTHSNIVGPAHLLRRTIDATRDLPTVKRCLWAFRKCHILRQGLVQQPLLVPQSRAASANPRTSIPTWSALDTTMASPIAGRLPPRCRGLRRIHGPKQGFRWILGLCPAQRDPSRPGKHQL